MWQRTAVWRPMPLGIQSNTLQNVHTAGRTTLTLEAQRKKQQLGCIAIHCIYYTRKDKFVALMVHGQCPLALMVKVGLEAVLSLRNRGVTITEIDLQITEIDL